MLRLVLIFFLLPVFAGSQSPKAAYNFFREVGVTGNATTYGAHFSWQGQISKKLYLGGGAELLRTVHDHKEVVRKDMVAPVMFRLSYASRLDGIRLVPYLATGVIVSQPTGTVLEAGIGLAAGEWQLSSSYRWYETNKELPSIDNGFYLRFSRLLITKATKPKFRQEPSGKPETVNR